MNGDTPLDRVSTRCRGEDGANLVEYAMLMALIVLVCLSAVQLFARNANAKMSCAASAISAAAGATC